MTRSRCVLLALLVLAASSIPLAAQAAKPKCFGQRATKVGTAGKDRIQGTSGNDVIVSKGGADRITGGGGNDLICSGGGGDVVNGGPGDDQLSLGGGNDEGIGGVGNDVIQGAAGSDFALGGEGIDNIVLGGGNDFSDPGPGIDRYDAGDGLFDGVGYLYTNGPVTVDLQAGTATGDGDDTLLGVEGVEGTRFDDTLSGTSGSNFLAGGGGSDVLDTRGNAGTGVNPDTVEQGTYDFVVPDHALGVYDTPAAAGDDTVIGGNGLNVVSFEESTGPITASLQSGVVNGMGADRLEDVNAIVGSTFDDDLKGSVDRDFFDGYGGSDSIDGTGERDVLVLFDGENVNVDLDADSATGNTTVFNTGEPRQVAFTYELNAIEDVWGSFSGNDRMSGTNGGDVFYGLGGNDTLIGVGGDDMLNGGDGNDSADGGAGTDTCLSIESPTACENSGTRSTRSGMASGLAWLGIPRLTLARF